MVGVPSLATTDVAPRFQISVTREEAGSAGETWLAEVDGLPRCSARGSTPDEAIRRAWAAAEATIDEDGDDDGGAEPRRKSGRYSGKLLVRMPSTLHGELAAAAEREGVSLNQLITGALAAAVEWRSAGSRGEPATERRDGLPRRLLIANLVALLVVACIAIALLVVAWRGL
jgi:predicted HicB family RNase H-like nuclease